MLSYNLRALRKKNGISQQELADTLGIPRTTLGDYERGKTEPNLALLIRLAKMFDIKVDDLIKTDLRQVDLEHLKEKQLKVLAITVDQENKENIEMVPHKASAGYLESFNDPTFIRELPKISFPNIPNGTYRAFEIQGDSMLPVEPGSIVICAYLESLANVKDGHCYVVVSKSEGLVYKRTFINKARKTLALVSDNELYPPFEIGYDEVGELWEFYACLSFTDAKKMYGDKLLERVEDIYDKLNQMESRLLN